MKRVIRIVLIVICLAVMCYSGYQIYQELSVYQEGTSTYESLTQFVDVAPQGEEIQAVPEIIISQETGEVLEVQWPDTDGGSGIQWPEVDFAALAEINSDVVGWLYSEGTVINYPVVQAEDDDYYLHRLFDGTVNRAGCLFLEAANAPDFSDPHSIIFGHHMRNGSMFKSLVGYKKQTYYDEHPVLLLMTPEKNYQIILFAGYVCPGDGDAWRLDFASEADRQQWIDTAIRKSTFTSGIVPTAEDRIITLSTCSYEYDDARYVVLGILREG